MLLALYYFMFLFVLLIDGSKSNTDEQTETMCKIQQFGSQRSMTWKHLDFSNFIFPHKTDDYIKGQIILCSAQSRMINFYKRKGYVILLAICQAITKRFTL